MFRSVIPRCVIPRLKSVREIHQSCVFLKSKTSKIPETPTWISVDTSRIPKVPEIDEQLLDHLERLSLVKFGNKEGVERLSAAIESANQLHMVNTDGIEPLDTVLEDMSLYVREDKIAEENCRDELMKLAVKTEEFYYVAPPGNIALKKTDKDYWEENKSCGKKINPNST